ncbi:MAG: hypothetical protein R3293_11795, partial [Candidatus Promineifilaceae bacterium]|nr:hypothetical protein [Candidatus Promineifilaceae bacterium]
MSKRSLPILFLLTVLFLSLLVVSAGAQPAVEGPPNPDPARLPQSGRHEHSFAATADTNGLPLSSWQRVAYQKWANDNWDIYLYDSNGSTRLTTNPAADYFPSLNRGGTMVAFSSGRDEPDGQLNLYTMNVDKSNLQRIVTGWTAFPAWSPDGKTIALQLWIDNNYEIFLVDADGSNLRRLTNNPDFDGQPAWSPDGKKIAFASSRNGAYAIYLMNADGSSQNQLSTFALSLHPTWSPDGQYIGFDADVDNDGWQELALIKRNGSDEQMIYNPGSTATSWAGSWSPDGKTLGFANISLTQSGSNWVWTEGEILEWDMENGSVTNLVPGVTNWYLDWETLDTIPPTTFLYEMREYSRADTFWMAWMGSDLG